MHSGSVALINTTVIVGGWFLLLREEALQVTLHAVTSPDDWLLTRWTDLGP